MGRSEGASPYGKPQKISRPYWLELGISGFHGSALENLWPRTTNTKYESLCTLHGPLYYSVQHPRESAHAPTCGRKTNVDNLTHILRPVILLAHNCLSVFLVVLFHHTIVFLFVGVCSFVWWCGGCQGPFTAASRMGRRGTVTVARNKQVPCGTTM